MAGKSSKAPGTSVPRVALLVSHPTQMEVPFYRFVAQCQSISLSVYFWSTTNLKEMVDPELGHPPGWDFDLTEGYQWALLPPQTRRQWSFLRRRVFQPGRYEAVIISGWGARAARLAAGAGWLSRSKFAVSTDTTRLSPRPLWKSIVRTLVFRLLFPFVPAFMVKGSLAQEHLIHFGVPPEKIFLFPYAIDNIALGENCALYRQQQAHHRSELGLSPGATVFLTVAKFISREGVFDLLRAYERIARGQRPVALLFVGDGPERAALVQFVNDRRVPLVVFAGYQPYSQLPKYYALADVFVHAALQEPWGVSVNEAMACRLPVIVSDRVGAAYDLVQEGENGFVFPAGNVEALENKLNLFLSLSSARRVTMGEASAALIRPWSYEKTLAEVQRMLLYFQEPNAPLPQKSKDPKATDWGGESSEGQPG